MPYSVRRKGKIIYSEREGSDLDRVSQINKGVKREKQGGVSCKISLMNREGPYCLSSDPITCRSFIL